MKITAIILAAGQSQRFGSENKLFTQYKSRPLVDHCLNSVLNFEFNDRILVTGFEHKRMNAHIKGLPLRAVHNADYVRGIGTSLATGAKSLKSDCDAFMVFLADMPEITIALIDQLTYAFEKSGAAKSIVRPVYKGKPGHPVLFTAKHARELQSLNNDEGAYQIIKNQKTSTQSIEVSTSAVIRDIDGLNDLET